MTVVPYITTPLNVVDSDLDELLSVVADSMPALTNAS